ncbi:hypothetical protein EMCRGX_G015495 [Ephydatia muelleri]
MIFISDDFLVPDFENPGPDPDDLTALKWGRDHYIRSFPHHLLKRKERNVRQTSSDALVVQDHQNIAYLGQTVGNVRQTSSDALVVQDHQNIAYLGQTVGNVRQTSSDALVVQDHQNIAYLGQTVGNVRQTSSDALVVQDHQNIAYLGQTVGNVRQTSSDALVVQDHQNIAYLGQTVGNVRQTSSDALVVQDHQNIAYLGQTVGNVRQTSSDALVVQDHQNIAYLGQTVGVECGAVECGANFQAVSDPSTNRYEVPWPPRSITNKAYDTLYTVTTGAETFNFTVSRADSGLPIFSTGTGFIFEDQFLQISALLPSSNIYGLGEHTTRLRLPTNITLTMFSQDNPPLPSPTENLYGVHPFYLVLEQDGCAHGVFLLNSNAMEVQLQSYPSITYRTIGGVLDFYFFLGPGPDQVIQQYTELIGRPYLPPYWSLGFHLSQWGYMTANNTLAVVERMRQKGIPQVSI